MPRVGTPESSGPAEAGGHSDTRTPLVEPRRYQRRPLGHAHTHHQLLFGVDGAIELEIGGHAYRVDGTHGLIVPAGEHHVCVALGDNLQLVADFPLASVALPARLLARPRAFALDAGLAERARGLALAGPPARLPTPVVWHRAATLATGLAGALGHHADLPDAARFPTLAVDAWLRASLHAPVRVDQLAERFGWRPRRFHTLFCEAFGDTPHQYQTRLRLDQAVQWLAGGERALSDIADALGYPDQPAFTRAFTRRFAMPPGAWRAAARMPDLGIPQR